MAVGGEPMSVKFMETTVLGLLVFVSGGSKLLIDTPLSHLELNRKYTTQMC